MVNLLQDSDCLKDSVLKNASIPYKSGEIFFYQLINKKIFFFTKCFQNLSEASKLHF